MTTTPSVTLHSMHSMPSMPSMPSGEAVPTAPIATAMPTWRQPQRRAATEDGQASVEYALVLLGAAIVATLLISWATRTNLIDALFDHVMSLIQGKAT